MRNVSYKDMSMGCFMLLMTPVILLAAAVALFMLYVVLRSVF